MVRWGKGGEQTARSADDGDCRGRGRARRELAVRGLGDAQSRKLHQLVERVPERVEELVVHLRSLLRVQKLHFLFVLSGQSITRVCVAFSQKHTAKREKKNKQSIHMKKLGMRVFDEMVLCFVFFTFETEKTIV